jgi:MurNAc alpha-1-phosphate uridylyltransferase
MILAAGKGERMRPLTDHTPKPLLRVAGKTLIEHHIGKLVSAGFHELVINVSWLGEQIEAFLGDGSAFGCAISWSREASPLETAGGIIQALPLLGEAPFAVVNGDIWTDYPVQQLRQRDLPAGQLAHLVMTDNPPQHPLGDFEITAAGKAQARQSEDSACYTYTGLGVYEAGFFAGRQPGVLPLRPLLDAGMAAGQVGAEYYPGRWFDVGTPQRLTELDALLGLH